MSHYDPVSMFSVTADSDGASNGILNSSASMTGILVHKVVLRQSASGSNVVSVALNDHPAIGTTNLLFTMSTNSQGGAAGDAYQRYASESFDPPLPFQQGLSVDVTGTAVSVQIYYTRR